MEQLGTVERDLAQLPQDSGHFLLSKLIEIVMEPFTNGHTIMISVHLLKREVKMLGKKVLLGPVPLQDRLRTQKIGDLHLG